MTKSTKRIRHPHLLNGRVGKCDIQLLRKTYGIPKDVILRNCSVEEHHAERDNDAHEVPIFASYFRSGLRLPMHPFTRSVLKYIGINPAQGNGNFYRVINVFIMAGNLIDEVMRPEDIFHVYLVKFHHQHQAFYFQRRPGFQELFERMPDHDDLWNKHPLMMSGNWETGPKNWGSCLTKVPRKKARSDFWSEFNSQRKSCGVPEEFSIRAAKLLTFSLEERSFNRMLEVYGEPSPASGIRLLEDKIADLVNADIDAVFNTKRKFLDEDDGEVTKAFEDHTYSRKGKGKINILKPWLNHSENTFQENSNYSSERSITSITETTSGREISQFSANASLSVTDINQVSGLCIENNLNACLEKDRTEDAATNEANMSILQESYIDDRVSEFMDSSEGDIWRPQFGPVSNPLTSISSPLTNPIDAMHLAREIITPADKIHINLKCAGDRYQEMISTIVKAAMLGISLEDKFKIMEQMESTVKGMDESIQNLKHHKASMEKKHNIWKKLLEAQVQQTRQLIAEEEKRANSAEAFVQSQKELYEKAFEKAIYFQAENATLTRELCFCEETLTTKNKEIEALTKELEEKKTLTDSLNEKAADLKSRSKILIEDAVKIAVKEAAKEYTKQINSSIVEYWDNGYKCALDDKANAIH